MDYRRCAAASALRIAETSTIIVQALQSRKAACDKPVLRADEIRAWQLPEPGMEVRAIASMQTNTSKAMPGRIVAWTCTFQGGTCQNLRREAPS